MARMSNEEIIFRASVELVEQGVLAIDEDGIEPMHTFEMWKQLGYTVRKGEKAICKLGIWKQGKAKKPENPDESGESDKKKGGFFFLKEAYFFKASQVAPLA